MQPVRSDAILRIVDSVALVLYQAYQLALARLAFDNSTTSLACTQVNDSRLDEWAIEGQSICFFPNSQAQWFVGSGGVKELR